MITEKDIKVLKKVRKYCTGRGGCDHCEFKPDQDLCMLGAPSSWAELSDIKISDECVWSEDETWFYSSCKNNKRLLPEKPTGVIYGVVKAMTRCYQCGRTIKWVTR